LYVDVRKVIKKWEEQDHGYDKNYSLVGPLLYVDYLALQRVYFKFGEKQENNKEYHVSKRWSQVSATECVKY
jgi:hypothetical protein